MPFFNHEHTHDHRYINCRDCDSDRALVEDLWRRYEPYADSNFPKRAEAEFHQRFWEMYLGVTLLEKGFNLKKESDKGPEFYVQLNDKKVWLEAIAISPGDESIPDSVPNFEFGKGREVPVEQTLLRFSSALADKAKCYNKARSDGIIASTDGYILAINSHRVSPGATIGNPVPYVVQAFFGIGMPGYAIDPAGHEIVDWQYPYRPDAAKINGKKIPMNCFLDSSAAFCSAVIHSSVDCANRPAAIGQDFLVILNPTATHPISVNDFPWWTRYTFDTKTNQFETHNSTIR